MSGGSFPGYRTACQVALSRLRNGRSLCSSPTSDRLLSGGSMTYPWLQEMHPTAKWCNKHVNQQVLASFQRPPKMSLPSVFWLSLDFGQGMHPYPRDEEPSARELLDLHFHRGPMFQCSRIAHSETCEKKQRQRQGAYPEENRQRDHPQARRRSRKEKYPS